MPNDEDLISDEQLNAELAKLKDIYNQLDDTHKATLRRHALALSVALDQIEPQHTTYSQIRELATLSADAGEYQKAFGVLEGFENTLVYKHARSTGNDIPHHALALVGQYLDDSALASLANTKNTRFFEHTQKSRLGRALLRHLIQRNDITAEEMITRHPNLIHYQGEVFNKKASVIISPARGDLSNLRKPWMAFESGMDAYSAFDKSPRTGETMTEANKNDRKLNTVNVFDLILYQADPNGVLGDNKKSNLGQKLLHHTIRGNQLAVVVILTQYPDLLLYRGNVHDYSGREFKNVTALQLALWALDVRHMAPAMLKCLTINDEGRNYCDALVPKLLQQVENFTKEGGVTYSMSCGLVRMSQDPTQIEPNEDTHEEANEILNRLLDRHDGFLAYNNRIFYFHNHSYPKQLVEMKDSKTIQAIQDIIYKEGKDLKVNQLHLISDDAALEVIQNNVPGSHHIFKERHYDVTDLINALDTYNANMKDNTWWHDQYVSYWCTKVGLKLHELPAHVAQHYCDRNMSFDPKNNNTPPTFEENVFQRTLNFDNWMYKDSSTPWWPTSCVSESNALGINFGISRGIRETASCTVTPGLPRKLKEASPCDANIDSIALTALCNKRTSEVLDLRRRLESLQKPNTDPEHRASAPSHP